MAGTPQLMVVFIGSLATIASIGMFVQFGDETDLLVPFIAAILWGTDGLLSFDVIVTSTDAVTRSEPQMSIAILFIGFGLVCALYGVWQIFKAPAREMEETDMGRMLR